MCPASPAATGRAARTRDATGGDCAKAALRPSKCAQWSLRSGQPFSGAARRDSGCCRGRALPEERKADPRAMCNDIAVIQYNKKNCALCFYQALTELPGDGIPAPGEPRSAGASDAAGIDGASWHDGQPHWLTPEATERIGCTGCHDNGGFIRSEYLAQLRTPRTLFRTSRPASILRHPLPLRRTRFREQSQLVDKNGARAQR